MKHRRSIDLAPTDTFETLAEWHRLVCTCGSCGRVHRVLAVLGSSRWHFHVDAGFGKTAAVPRAVAIVKATGFRPN